MRRYTLPLTLLCLFLVLGFFLNRETSASEILTPKRGLILPVVAGSRTRESSKRTPASVDAPVGIPAVDTLKAEDLCAYLRKPNYDNPTEAKRKLMKDLRPSLTSQDSAVLNWLLELEDKKTAPVVSIELLTLMGLDDSGLVLGRRLPDQLNMESSVTLLEEARRMDPSNGALDIYLASVYRRRGEAAKSDEYLERGLKSERFEVYMPRLMRKLLAAPKNAIDFVKAVQLFSVMPIPDLNPIRDFLRAKARDEKFAPAVFSFAQGIVDEAINSRTPYNHLDWWLSSYVMGANILQLRGDQPPRAFDLYQEFGRFPEIPNVSLDEACNTAELERAISDFQALLRK